MPFVIFDMDDTLVATADVWRAAETRLLDSLGVTRTEELAIQYKGMNALDVAATIYRILQPRTHTLAQCQHIMRSALLDQFRNNATIEMPGALACVRLLASKTKTALASGSPLEAIELATKRLGMHSHFNVILSSESVKRGKPHPDVFLEAAKRLGVQPKDCLVFEDSLIGVEAALAANMHCFAVPSGNHAAIQKKATRVFPSLDAITWKDIESPAH